MNNVVTKVVSKTDQFFKSNISFIILPSIFILLTIFQYIWFGLGHELGGKNMFASDAWKTWCLLTFFCIGSIFNIMATIYTIRLENKFFKYQFIATIFVCSADILLCLYFDFTKMVLLTIIAFVRKINWKKDIESGSKVNVKNEKFRLMAIHAFIAFAITVALGYSMKGINSVIPEDYQDKIPFLDAFCISFLIYGCVLQIKGVSTSWLMFACSDLTYVLIMIKGKQLSAATLGSIYFLIDLISYLSWNQIAKIDEENYLKSNQYRVFLDSSFFNGK